MPPYSVIEDDGGGLHLYVFEGTRVVYSHSGYEHCPGQLSTDLLALQSGDTTGWDGCEEDPQASWDYWRVGVPGWRVIADNNGTLIPECMGAAGRKEFYPNGKV